MGPFPLLVSVVWEEESDAAGCVNCASLGPGRSQGQEGWQAFRGLMG